MSDYLVIVESPSKSKTIKKFLGDNYEVMSSIGHIRDLSTHGRGGLGVDINNNFKPDYKLINGKFNIVRDLKSASKKAKHVFLATDPDREGEAISWHLFDELNLEKEKSSRVLFNEITKNAVLEAFNKTRDIDYDLVKSQESRRILDRIIGFKLSSLLKSKIGSKSAGRVQSAALRITVDREKEIAAFIAEEYWKFDVEFIKNKKQFKASLDKYKNKKIEINNENEANKVVSDLEKGKYIVSDITENKRTKNSPIPFITSSLQQEAHRRFGYPARKTMAIAHKLYEGVELKSGRTGLITYTRTDSVRLSDVFVAAANDFINQKYGKKYAKGTYSKAKKTNGNVQDAHEAIRPTDLNVIPEDLDSLISDKETFKKYPFGKKDIIKIYELIYYRTLASFMKSANIIETAVTISNNDYDFKTAKEEIIFDGYLRVYQKIEGYNVKLLPELEVNEVLDDFELITSQEFTKPPARYTEAGLIKKMEELGIGRPSTYAQTMEILKKRGYVEVKDKRFVPSEQGMITTDRLIEFFPKIVDAEYTARVETVLDDIAEGKRDHVHVLDVFYERFVPQLNNARANMPKLEPKETGELCPECGSPLVIKKGKYGEFTACKSFPTCKYIKQEKKEVEIIEGVTCPECKEGHIVKRVSKRGKSKGNTFYACDNFPKCKFISSEKPVGNCEICGSLLIEKDNEIICQNAECEYNKK